MATAFKFTWHHLLAVTAMVFLVTPTALCKENKGCSVREMDLSPCFRLPNDPFSIDDSCCKVLNKAVKSGFNCLCFLLGSLTPPLSASALSLPLSNCLIEVPSLTHCDAVIPFLTNRSSEAPPDHELPFHPNHNRPFFLPPSPPTDTGRRNSNTEPPPAEPSDVSNHLTTTTTNEAGSIKMSLHQILLLSLAFQASYVVLLNHRF